MSSSRITVEDLKPYVGDLGFCFPADDDRFLLRLNEAEERLQAYGRWWGSIQEVQFCVRDCVLIWPREVDTIEALSLDCSGPLDIQNEWYSYTRAYATLGACPSWSGGAPLLGWGSGPCGPQSMMMSARSPASFDVTRNSGETIRFYPASSSDAGKTIIVQGRDASGVWVRTQPVVGGPVIDGEQVTLAMPYAETVKTWAAGMPQAISKQVTNYRVLMYSYNISTQQLRALGTYQPGETNPVYRTSKIPALANGPSGCSGSSSCCEYSTVRALVKLAHVPLRGDGDWLLYRNFAAYVEAITAVMRWREGDLAAGNFHFFGQVNPKQSRMSNQATLTRGGAIPMLRAELRSMTADRTDVTTHYEHDDRLNWTLAGYR